jgi:Holliday junction resolvase RusA-like endonuclease
MTDRIELVIYSKPTALSRQGRGQFGGQFKSPNTVKQIARVIEAWNEAGQPTIAEGTPLTLVATFFFDRPKNHYRTGKFADQLKPGLEDAEPISRPDLSNLLKLIEDALQGYAFDDDSRITTAYLTKAFTNEGEFARTEVVIRAKGTK